MCIRDRRYARGTSATHVFVNTTFVDPPGPACQSPAAPCLCIKPSIAIGPGKLGRDTMGAFPGCEKDTVLTPVVQIIMKSLSKFHLPNGCSLVAVSYTHLTLPK